jgi:hypothetical protein
VSLSCVRLTGTTENRDDWIKSLASQRGVAKNMSEQTEIDVIIKDSLQSFYEDVGSLESSGREREMISLFAFGYLVKSCRPKTVLYDSTQIGIEVAVQQLPRSASDPGRGSTVCKDIVIWHAPRMTLWKGKERHNEPLVVMEWKVNYSLGTRHSFAANRRGHAKDINWLLDTSVRINDDKFVGYAVFLDCTTKPQELTCVRVKDNKAEKDWFVPASAHAAGA